MSPIVVALKMTAEEYLSCPDLDGLRTDLIEGEVVVNSPAWRHQVIRDDIHFALVAWTSAEPGRGRATSPLDVRVDDRNVYAPDVLWFGADRVPARSYAGPSPTPHLAVEVRSPSTWRYDVGPKKSGYERIGVRELWLVDTAADSVLVFRRSSARRRRFDVVLELNRDAELTSPLLPGFSLSLTALLSTG